MELNEELKKCYSMMELLYDQKYWMEFINTPADDLLRYHIEFGPWIRNHLLNEEGVLYKLFLENNVKDKSDMVFIIIESFHQHLLNKYKK